MLVLVAIFCNKGTPFYTPDYGQTWYCDQLNQTIQHDHFWDRGKNILKSSMYSFSLLIFALISIRNNAYGTQESQVNEMIVKYSIRQPSIIRLFLCVYVAIPTWKYRNMH